MSLAAYRQSIWTELTQKLEEEWAELPADRRLELCLDLQAIMALQKRLQELFSAAGGDDVCGHCGGECCQCGQHHMGLVNLLTLLSQNRPLPKPDYRRGCPWLGDRGCTLRPEFRPYDCVSFLCEATEQRLSPVQRREFYTLEQLLRSRYGAFAKQFAGASLQGVLLRFERLGDRGLLSRP